jgi:endogenous inhibitor of DNA gyrase (YacG/DUF329 family)
MAEAATNTEEVLLRNCPHCGAQSDGAHFCPDCGRIQPVASGSDHFGFFGLPRRLRIEESELEKSFYALSKLSSDYFMSSSEGTASEYGTLVDAK